MSARRLGTIAVEKPWGKDVLPAPFTGTGEGRIGEIWFEPPAEWPDVLVKYLFTSEKLSVQVHPDDARAPEGSRGKEECWIVLDAEPGATLAAGFTTQIDAETMRDAATDGSIEARLEWHQVQRGDFFFLPAGTVHAIGAGLSILEIQQNSDVTYRLFDYGRPRELHLDEAVAVAQGQPYSSHLHRSDVLSVSGDIVLGAHFDVAILRGRGSHSLEDDSLILPLSGAVSIAGERVAAGQCIFAESGTLCELADDGLAVRVDRSSVSTR